MNIYSKQSRIIQKKELTISKLARIHLKTSFFILTLLTDKPIGLKGKIFYL